MATSCELEGVHKSFGGRQLFADFQLQVEAQEMVAITGPSGSGKSTLLNMIGLLDSPDRGTVRLLGNKAPKPRTHSANRYLRHHLGYLFQNFGLIENVTVRQNLKIALTYAGQRSLRNQRIAEALSDVGLPGAEDRPVYSLSGGEQQRVAVARLLLKPCEIVLADEPTGSLDSENRDVVLGLLCELNKKGKTIVIATHDPVVESACTRAVALENSREG